VPPVARGARHRAPASRGRRRLGVGSLVAALVASALVAVVLPAPLARAAGTVLFQNSFATNTVNGTGSVTVPAPTSGTNAACLTASGNAGTGPLLSCPGTTDSAGTGKLRLTNASGNQVGGVFGTTSFPTSSGLDLTFNSYQWGGGGADGLAFMLAAVNPANPTTPTSIGPGGGSLGYSSSGSIGGLPNAYLGVGFDVYGNFSAPGWQGSGCPTVTNINASVPGAVVVRGPGNGLVGYCGQTTTYNGTTASKVTLRAATRAASAVPVQVLINPTAVAFTSDSGVSVPSGSYKVVVTPVGQATRTLSGTLPAASASLYPSSTWLGANGVPKQLAFAFVGSTGSITDNHEVSDVKALTFAPVPQLTVSTTSYSATAPTAGDPVNYSVTAGVAAGGAPVATPISVTQTVPAGMVPSVAYGTGWVCQSPVARTVTCTTSSSSFAAGTILPPITVVAIVTGSGITSTVVQNGSPTQASSADGTSGTDLVTTAASPATAPSAISVSPAIGPVSGGGTVDGDLDSPTAPTAIMIGTVAEQQAGTPVVLVPCASGQTTGCFTFASYWYGDFFTISSMPGRTTAATARVTVVSRGAAGSTSYVYADRPATMAAPTATAGINTVALSWTAPAANGSAITQYVVTPYLNGTAQPSQTFGAATTSTTFTGLAAGGSWTYTVAAVNAYGTSVASPASTAVLPYQLPGAPTVTSLSARNSAVLMTWTAPSSGGSAITAYVVTPYVGTVAQPTQTFGAGTTQTVTGLTPGTAYTFTVAARNAAGTGPASARTAAVTPNSSPSLSFTAPPPGEAGVAYSHPLTVTNGTSPFVWSVSSGTLPAGLTLNASTGVLSGTPTAGGSTTFVVQVTDAAGESATRSVTLVIAAAPVVTFTPPAGQVGIAYSQQPSLTGGTAPFVWSISSGSLPTGLAVNSSTGLVSGTPTTSGSFSVTIAATDSFGQVAARTATIVVTARPAFATGAPPAAQLGSSYTTTFTVTGGTAPLTWSIAAGSAPPGLTLGTATGVLSGTPTGEGSYPFTVSVVDAYGQTATKAVTLVVGAGALVVRKVADVSTAAAGAKVSYTITIANTGSSARTGVDLQDPLTGVLDDAAYNADATATSGTLTYAASTLGWTGSIAAGGTLTITYSVTVASGGAGNKTLSNTATSTTLGTNCAGGSNDVRCSSTVNVAGLTMVKTADVTSTTPGGTVRFQVVVTNTGSAVSSGAAFTDELAGVLDDATYRGDGNATTGSVSLSGSALTWTGTLAPGATATITYSATVRDPDPGNKSLTSTLVSSSAGSSCPGSNPAAACSITVPVLVPSLVVANAASTSTTTPGASVPHTVTVSNTGQTAYPATSVSIALAGALDDATYAGGATASAGTLGYAGGTLTWTGNLATGAVVTITYALTVKNPDPGDRALTTVATSTAAGSTCPTGGTASACTSMVRVLVPGLTISTSADVSTTTPGSVVRHTVVATNTGQTDFASATFATSLTAVRDDASYNGDAVATVGSVAYSSPTITWTGALPVGATVTLRFSTTVRTPDPGNQSLVTRVSSTTAGSNCAASSTDPRCVSTVYVLLPGLTFTSSSDVATTTPGGVVVYTQIVTNTGETPQSNVVALIDLGGLYDDARYDNDALVSVGSQVVDAEGNVHWTLTLAPGESATATVSFTVDDPDTGDRVLRTLITSAAAGSACPTGTTNAACRTAVTVLVPGLTITKTADRATVLPGAPVAYTIDVVNNGQTTYSAATFADDLTAVLTDATYAGGATATSGTLSYSSSVLSWTGSLAPGASATISYSVLVNDPATGDQTMTNTVVSTSRGSTCPAGGTNPACRSDVLVTTPGLTFSKTANRATTKPGETVGYTVSVTNSGATAYSAAAFADSLVGVVDDATFVAGSLQATAGSVSRTGSTISWTGALAIGATATVTYSVVVQAADVGDDVLVSSLSSSTRGSNCAAGSPDARCATSVPVARLVLQQAANVTTTTPGSPLVVTQTFTNTGRVPYTQISVVSPRGDTSDDIVPQGDQTVSSGTLVRTDTEVIWTGDIPVGGTVTSTRTLVVKDPDPGNKVITATLSSTAAGNSCPASAPAPSCTFTVLVLVPALSITKTASATATVPGGTVGYTITVHNTGQAPYAGAVVEDTLAGVLDDATYDGNAVATSGSVTYAAPGLSWVGDLAVGATATITYSVTARAPDPGDKTMVNPVSSSAPGSTCPPAGGGAACYTTVAVLTPALTILKTANRTSVTLGSRVTYTVQVTNSGQTSYPAAGFSDSLAGVLDDATYDPTATTATSGTVGYSGGVLSWSGALAPGSSATVVFAVTVNNPDTGDHSLVDTVTSTTTGSNCAAGSGDTRCTATVAVTNAVSLTFAKSAGVTAVAPGGTVGYTVTAVNSSDEPVAANLTDPLAGILDDAAWAATLQADGGTATFAGSTVSWSGTVPAHGTVTITYAVVVHTAVTGDQVLAGTISSTLPATSNNCLPSSTDPRCVNALPVARLLVQQAYTETSTTPGSLLHLSATFTNTGTMAYEGITIASPSAGTVDDAVPTGDQTATSGDLVLTSTAITWTGDIPVGGTVTVVGTLTVKNPDTGDRLITGTLVSSALGNNCPAGGSDGRCTASVPVLLPGLTLTKVASATTAQPGDTVGYTVTVANTGQSDYASATVTDSLIGVLDDAVLDAGAVASTGSLAYSGPASTLTWTGALAAGSAATVSYSVTVDAAAAGDKNMVNPVSSTDAGSTCPPASSNAACRSSVSVLTPALTVAASAGVATTVPGATVTHTVTATNTGQTTYAAAHLTVSLADLLDDATYAGGAAATTGSVSVAGGALAWTGVLAPGAAVTITYVVTVSALPAGDFSLDQVVVSDSPGSTCPASSSDPACSTSVPVASLGIVNSADVTTTKPTGVVRNSVTVTNRGQVPYVDLVVNDNLLGSVDDATYNGDATATSGTLLLVTGTGQVRWTGDLAPGDSFTVTGSLTVNNPPAGNRNLSTVVTSGAAGSSCPAGSGSPDCTTSVPVLMPGLTITKTADASVTAPGATVGYTITATNTGQTAYAGAVITDQLAGVLNGASYGADATASTGSIGYAAPVLTWTGDLAVGASVTIQFTVVVDSVYRGDGHLENWVLSEELGSTCPSAGPAGACGSFVPVLVPRLDVAVTSDRATTVPGGTVGYTVAVRNTGQSAYVGATVTTTLAGVLDDATYAGGASADRGAVTYAAPSLTWVGDLEVGATATVTYTVTVGQPDAGNLDLATSVSSSASGSTCGNEPQCTDHVTVLVPGLAVSTSADVATATPGDPVAFTVVVANTGQTPYVGTTVTSDLADVLDDAVPDGAAVASTGVVTRDGATLSWTGSLAPGESATIRYRVTVSAAGGGDRTMSATVVAAAQGSTCPPGTASSTCTATVDVLVPALTIVKSAGAPTTTPGSVVGYTIAVTNTGETAYAAASLDDSLAGVLSDAAYNDDASVVAGGGVVGYSGSTLSWTGALPVGASATITYSVTVDDPDRGDKRLTNTVVSSSPGSTCPAADPAASCTAVVDVLVPGLVVTKASGTSTVVAGSALEFTITATNTGQTDYAPAIITDSLAAVLDDATYADDATATYAGGLSAGAVAYDGTTLAWQGPLPVGAVVTITYSVAADFPAEGSGTLTNTAVSPSAGSSCRVPGPDCTVAVDVLVPALVVSKHADSTDVAAGATVGYTITATNTGEADYPSVTVTDPLSGLLDDATYGGDAAADSGAVTYQGGVLTWTGAVARGATVTITFSVTTVVEGLGDATLTNRVVSAVTGSTCTAASVDPACVTATSVAPRSIELSDLTSEFTMTGPPHATVSSDGAVTMTVTTNSPGGYDVTVLAQDDVLRGGPGNDETVPISLLGVRETGGTGFSMLSEQVPTTVHGQSRASAPGGDAVSNDYRVQMPNVAPDTYSTTLDYLVTAR
jgi:uncharacterized repeat protein (TIGR01451 family)